MDAHLKWAGRPDDEQRAALEAIVRGHAVLMEVLEGLRAMELPDHLVGSGAIYNAVWSHLTGKPLLTGTKDIDVIYFDDSDLSYEAEDAVIRSVVSRFAHLPVPVEVRNQARVHLWFPERFGFAVPPLERTKDALLRYASKTHAVAIRLEADGALTIEAPFGLDDMFAFRITPNRSLDNKYTHHEKGARAKAIWPEIEVVPW
ncbi:nucleotidyltransferase family protein [Pelagibacterium xiamenense]|uniref:nucleotidyltransferase family protein n=1 Tax=Pelagibacterium xiamenense TaxID=2901140 RepID=UPI001E345946|nr:nucleotidyltransferase family protein [Pelagibacterium xiamenense]MCD7060466.1 nucleotidyltransferase family protein [Pelagibacterium xiamenense]